MFDSHLLLQSPLLLNKELSIIEVGERLLLFGAESFLFQFAIQKFKDQDL